MKQKTSHLALLSVVVCGCASQQTPQLFFGEQVTVGIEIGAGASSEGFDFTLGYKDLDIAIIPVSALISGQAQEIAAWNQENGGNRRDALSVFGQFKGQGGIVGSTTKPSDKTSEKITLGRFFATGLAATSLAEGYMEGWSDSTARTNDGAKASAKATVKPGPQTEPAVVAAPSQNPSYTPPLVFAQTNTVGLGVGTSVANQGAHFTLGYTGRDIALVPVMAPSADGSLSRLGGRNQINETAISPDQWAESDALSVFGQFKVDSETSAARFGLSRFFTTGMAARNLAEGFKAEISRELKAERQKPTAPKKKASAQST